MHLRPLPTLVAAVLALAALSGGAEAQTPDDVEMLGRVHGTTPPATYYRLKLEQPNAFQFGRAWKGRNPHLRPAGAGGPGADGSPTRWEALPLRSDGGAGSGRDGGLPRASLGPRDAVLGDFRVPLVLGLFSDSPEAPWGRDDVQREFFDGPNSRHGTITEFYHEISGGRVNLTGDVRGWARSTLTRAQVSGGKAMGLGGPARVGEFIIQTLHALDDGTVDWGRYDNDGPDGVPNSGDDDGYVDVLAVMHPTRGAECGRGDGYVWSHKWTLSSAAGQEYVTSTPAASGGFIRISDYTIQPATDCDTVSINRIGVLAHELGHGFGLPDLYATVGSHSGIGGWGLMGTGSWGCSQGEPERPCHMNAWSKAMLGWVDVETLPAEADLGTLTLGPVETTGRVYRIDAGDGSGEYYLLENRQRSGFDQGLPRSGLLVWHIDEPRVLNRWLSNSVNADASRMGVWLRQADGLNELARAGGGRGDSGDPFPGDSARHAFHAGSSPASFTHAGASSGLTLFDLQEVGGDVRFRAVTGYRTIRVRVEGEVDGEGILTVDGGVLPGVPVFQSAPFEPHELIAAPWAAVSDGVRTAFERWQDAPSSPPERTFVTGLSDSTLTVVYGGARQVRLRLPSTGERFGVLPGTVEVTPPAVADGHDFWVDHGSRVALEARPTPGFRFVEWTGDLAGAGNPVELETTSPRTATAAFEMSYAVAEATGHGIEATRPQHITLEATDGTPPLAWSLLSGTLPDGLDMGADGVIEGVAMEMGAFELLVEARDARGLRASGTLVLEVGAPRIPVVSLAAPFLLQGSGPNPIEREFLDREGNANGVYDLGDLRAFLLANPGLPETGEEQAAVQILLPMLEFGTGGGG